MNKNNQEAKIQELKLLLRQIKDAVDSSRWHSVNGEQLKRIYLAKTAIARINAALEESS